MASVINSGAPPDRFARTWARIPGYTLRCHEMPEGGTALLPDALEYVREVGKPESQGFTARRVLELARLSPARVVDEAGSGEYAPVVPGSVPVFQAMAGLYGTDASRMGVMLDALTGRTLRREWRTWAIAMCAALEWLRAGAAVPSVVNALWRWEYGAAEPVWRYQSGAERVPGALAEHRAARAMRETDPYQPWSVRQPEAARRIAVGVLDGLDAETERQLLALEPTVARAAIARYVEEGVVGAGASEVHATYPSGDGSGDEVVPDDDDDLVVVIDGVETYL